MRKWLSFMHTCTCTVIYYIITAFIKILHCTVIQYYAVAWPMLRDELLLGRRENVPAVGRQQGRFCEIDSKKEVWLINVKTQGCEITK